VTARLLAGGVACSPPLVLLVGWPIVMAILMGDDKVCQRDQPPRQWESILATVAVDAYACGLDALDS